MKNIGTALLLMSGFLLSGMLASAVADDQESPKPKETSTDDSSPEKGREARPNRPARQGREGFGNVDPGTMFDNMDKNGDGTLSADEIPERQKPFVDQILKAAGKETTAEITRDEFTSAMKKQMQARRNQAGPGRRPRGEGEPGPEAGRAGRRPPQPRMFIEIDTDKDGKISRKELKNAVSLFEKLDENGDGQIDMREMMGPPPMREGAAEANESKGPRKTSRKEADSAKEKAKPGKEKDAGQTSSEKPAPDAKRSANRLLTKSDTDKSSTLSKDEVTGRLSKRFDKIDTNGDGQLDRAEIENDLLNNANREKGKKNKSDKKKSESKTPEEAT